MNYLKNEEIARTAKWGSAQETDFDRRQRAMVPRTTLAEVLEETEGLSIESLTQHMSAKLNQGEPAIVAEVQESPLWYVDVPDRPSVVSDKRAMTIATFVLEWAASLDDEEGFMTNPSYPKTPNSDQTTLIPLKVRLDYLSEDPTCEDLIKDA